MYALQIVDTTSLSRPRKYRFYLSSSVSDGFYYLQEFEDEYYKWRFRRIK